jgi:hypothetical protein
MIECLRSTKAQYNQAHCTVSVQSGLRYPCRFNCDDKRRLFADRPELPAGPVNGVPVREEEIHHFVFWLPARDAGTDLDALARTIGDWNAAIVSRHQARNDDVIVKVKRQGAPSNLDLARREF